MQPSCGRCRGAMAALVVAIGAASTASGGTTRPATTTKATTRKISSNVAATPVREAVAAMTREFELFLRKPSSSVRTSSDYFKGKSDIAPDAITAALQGEGPDPRVSAYVKWQLLSGLPDRLDGDVARQVLHAYHAAPAPLMRPGVSNADRQKLDQLLAGVKQGDEGPIVEQFEAAVNEVRRGNTPILAYRDELYRRLPKNFDTFAVALDDLQQRQNASAEGKETVKLLIKDMRDWSVSEAATPQALTALSRAVRRLGSTKRPQYYDEPYWREAGGFAWRKTTRSSIDTGHTLKDAAVFLEEQASAPPLAIPAEK